MYIDIFKVNKVGNKVYQTSKPSFKNNCKKISSETETVYIYKNLQLSIDKSGNKICNQVIPKETKTLNNNIIVRKYELKHTPISSFPFLDKYDDCVDRSVEKYIWNNNEFMIIRDNETLYFRIKDDVDLDKFIKEIF